MSESYLEAAHLELRVESWSNSARTLLIRGHTLGGPLAEQHVTNADRSRAEEDFELHGVPKGIRISPLTAPVRRGECYVRMTLMADGEPVQTLSTGYLTDSRTLSWPPGIHEGFTDGPGLVRLVTGANPAAGDEHVETVPTNARWKLLSWKAQLICDATVTTRRPILVLDDGSTTFLTTPGLLDQTASQARSWYFLRDYPGTPTDYTTSFYGYLPAEIYLFQGYRILTTTNNIQAGDDWGVSSIMIEEWIEE